MRPPHTEPRDVVVVGSIARDHVLRVPLLPREGESTYAYAYDSGPGGKGLNQAIAAARTGVPTTLLACRGYDHEGYRLARFLESEGFDSRTLDVAASPTGVAYVSVDDAGRNHIVSLKGANALLSVDYVRQSSELLTSAKVLLTQFVTSLEPTRVALELAHRHEVLTIVNAAPALPDESSLLDLADILVMNEVEASTYARCELGSLAAIADAARTLARRHQSTVIVTRGSKGALAVTPHAELLHEPFTVDVVDTTGAGDAFCGALATALARNETFDDAFSIASAAAALATTQVGAALTMPREAEVRRLLEEQPVRSVPLAV